MDKKNYIYALRSQDTNNSKPLFHLALLDKISAVQGFIDHLQSHDVIGKTDININLKSIAVTYDSKYSSLYKQFIRNTINNIVMSHKNIEQIAGVYKETYGVSVFDYELKMVNSIPVFLFRDSAVSKVFPPTSGGFMSITNNCNSHPIGYSIALKTSDGYKNYKHEYGHFLMKALPGKAFPLAYEEMIMLVYDNNLNLNKSIEDNIHIATSLLSHYFSIKPIGAKEANINLGFQDGKRILSPQEELPSNHAAYFDATRSYTQKEGMIELNKYLQQIIGRLNDFRCLYSSILSIDPHFTTDQFAILLTLHQPGDLKQLISKYGKYTKQKNKSPARDIKKSLFSLFK